MQDATRRSDACALFVRSARGQRVDVATGTREDSLEIYDYQRRALAHTRKMQSARVNTKRERAALNKYQMEKVIGTSWRA